MKLALLAALPVSLATISACSGQTPDGTMEERPSSPEPQKDASAGTGPKADDAPKTDDAAAKVDAPKTDEAPALFGGSIERVMAKLPTKGQAAQTPWSGSTWPASTDSINHRWDDRSSPAATEKYETAFRASDVQHHVSASHGLEGGGASCLWNSMCGEDICGRRNDSTLGRCVSRRANIEPGWASAAILVPEPQHEVVENGVTFKETDIKALASMLYTKSERETVSLHCNEDESALNRDKHTRSAAKCRHTNPGTLHLLLANYLGIRKQAFVENRPFYDRVSNRPVRGYQIQEQRVVSDEEANRLVLGDASSPIPTSYAFNSGAKSFLYVKTRVAYVRESNAGEVFYSADAYTTHDEFTYILELDGKGAIIGGEWVGASKNVHADSLWLPKPVTSGHVAGISYNQVKKLVDASIANP
ncbi:hypothetical protein LVJ94_51095 [Pendulispora rubella]|uniref:Lipoprotein n=1 Tax=Pendulispora rubella TaxID=2741070 RepID=A0ABZ2L944_9BACT